MCQTWYEYFFGEDEVQPDERQVHLRHLLLKQIKLSNVALKPILKRSDPIDIPKKKKKKRKKY